MEKGRFIALVQDALDSLPREFREHIRNVAVLVEDYPPDELHRPRRDPGAGGGLLLGVFVGVPTIHKSFFAQPTGPDHILLFQKNIEAVCSTDDEIREQVRRTVIHEFGHYFGLDEERLKDV